MNNYSTTQKIAAWSVHVFTATGIIFAFLALLAISASDWKMAMFHLVICFIIDGVDGTLARKFNVQEVLPEVSGKMIDYVIDFITYAFLPAYFFYSAGLCDSSLAMIAACSMLMVSAVYYGILDMVTKDLYFRGFPVLWNFVIYFLFFVYDFSSIGNFIVVIILSILHFVPIKFVYPSRTEKLQKLTIAMTVILLATMFAALVIFPAKNIWLTACATMTLLYFSGFVIYSTFDRSIQ